MCIDIPLVQGWQMISFHCISSNAFQILSSVQFGINDEIKTRDGGLVFARYDGTKWQGRLAKAGLSYAKGYMVYFSGSAGLVIKQSGEAQLPVEHVVLSRGWNWVGYAPFERSSINCDAYRAINVRAINCITVVSGQFTADDQVKTRSGNSVSFSNYDGSKFQGTLTELEPGVGYEVRVAQAVTFRYESSISGGEPTGGGGAKLSFNLLNSGCSAHFVLSDELGDFSDSATTIAAVLLNGDQIGYPIDGTMPTTSCDQVAAIGVVDGLVRGTSDTVSDGFAVGIIGKHGEKIKFKYWSALEQREYDVPWQYTLVPGDKLGSIASTPLQLEVSATPVCNPCESGCSHINSNGLMYALSPPFSDSYQCTATEAGKCMLHTSLTSYACHTGKDSDSPECYDKSCGADQNIINDGEARFSPWLAASAVGGLMLLCLSSGLLYRSGGKLRCWAANKDSDKVLMPCAPATNELVKDFVHVKEVEAAQLENLAARRGRVLGGSASQVPMAINKSSAPPAPPLLPSSNPQHISSSSSNQAGEVSRAGQRRASEPKTLMRQGSSRILELMQKTKSSSYATLEETSVGLISPGIISPSPEGSPEKKATMSKWQASPQGSSGPSEAAPSEAGPSEAAPSALT